MGEAVRGEPDKASIERVTRAAVEIAKLSRLYEELQSPEAFERELEYRKKLKEKLPYAKCDIADKDIIKAVLEEKRRLAELYYKQIVFGLIVPAQESVAQGAIEFSQSA